MYETYFINNASHTTDTTSHAISAEQGY